MIHSMSGGVMGENGFYRFVKVEVEKSPMWFTSPYAVEAGDKVLVPFGKEQREGVVLRSELCTPQTAPIPVGRAREILGILPKS